MSFEFYLACHDCKKAVHVGCDGLSGFQFLSIHLREFFAKHALMSGHRMEMVGEHEMDRLTDESGYEDPCASPPLPTKEPT